MKVEFVEVRMRYCIMIESVQYNWKEKTFLHGKMIFLELHMLSIQINNLCTEQRKGKILWYFEIQIENPTKTASGIHQP